MPDLGADTRGLTHVPNLMPKVDLMPKVGMEGSLSCHQPGDVAVWSGVESMPKYNPYAEALGLPMAPAYVLNLVADHMPSHCYSK